jgi:hypothetical protein
MVDDGFSEGPMTEAAARADAGRRTRPRAAWGTGGAAFIMAAAPLAAASSHPTAVGSRRKTAPARR